MSIDYVGNVAMLDDVRGLAEYEHHARLTVGAAPDAQGAVASYADTARLRVKSGHVTQTWRFFYFT